MPTFSVVVCTRNRPLQLDHCLAALARLEYPDYEVIVVDNAPSDQRSRDVASRWGVRYLVEPLSGLSRARNRGARACEKDIVAYLDDDAIAEPSWLSTLAGDFQDPLVGAVTGAILATRSSDEPESGETAPGRERGQHRVVDQNTPRWFEIANFGDIGDGSNMAFRRSAFQIWTGFDARLGRGAILSGGEEHYAFFNLIELGYRIVYNPAAIVRHPCAHAARELRGRHLRLLTIATAYITRLAIEHPSCRRDLRRYVFDRLRGGRWVWANSSGEKVARIAPRWLCLLAMLSGPWVYLRARLARSPVGRPDAGSEQKSPFKVVPDTAIRDRHSHVES